jgi:uncharacterized membrane protein (UPF0136 family)
MSSASVYLAFAMSAFMLIGGSMGFVKKQSKASLIAGSVTGLWYAFGGYSLLKGDVQAGLLHGVAVSVLLSVVFGIRYFNGRKTMALIIALSALGSAVHFYTQLQK